MLVSYWVGPLQEVGMIFVNGAGLRLGAVLLSAGVLK